MLYKCRDIAFRLICIMWALKALMSACPPTPRQSTKNVFFIDRRKNENLLSTPTQTWKLFSQREKQTKSPPPPPPQHTAWKRAPTLLVKASRVVSYPMRLSRQRWKTCHSDWLPMPPGVLRSVYHRPRNCRAVSLGSRCFSPFRHRSTGDTVATAHGHASPMESPKNNCPYRVNTWHVLGDKSRGISEERLPLQG